MLHAELPPMSAPQDSAAELNLAAWAEAFEHMARHHGVPFSSGSARQAALAMAGGGFEEVENLASRFGLALRAFTPAPNLLSSLRLPLIALFDDGTLGVVTARTSRDGVTILFGGADGQGTATRIGDVLARAELFVSAQPAKASKDERVDAYVAPYSEHWFRSIALQDFPAYGYVLLAALVANMLALSGALFSMQVYDRVIPAKSLNTLYVLFAGVILSLVFDFGMRKLRAAIIDIVGKRADLRMSDLVFGHALRIKNSARPASTGSFIAQLRDLDQVRELLTSTTIAAVADLPFFFLFLFFFGTIGGPLSLVPALAVVLLVLPGLLAQGALKAGAGEAKREASLRHAILVEAVQGIEDIKGLQAEEQFQRKWNQCNAVLAEAQLRLRRITSGLTAWSGCVQTGCFAVIVLVGAPMVIAGDMSTGALVACSMIGSRMIAPMGQLTQVLSRLQHARMGLRSVEGIMRLPTDYPEAQTRLSAPVLLGRYALTQASYGYAAEAGKPALLVDKLRMEAGEKIAVLGRNGAGKSTLLLALSGMIEPCGGEALLDGLPIAHIDPADLRTHVGALTQNSRLFHGTIRENLMLGAPRASQATLLDALAMVGADDFISSLSKGLDYPVLEGGRGLSGGQQQALLLARLIVRAPQILLLDEPTAAMDETAERRFITGFAQWSAERTVIIATHRMRVLDLVSRVIAVEAGRIVLDQSKDEALKRLHGLNKVVRPSMNQQGQPGAIALRGRQ